MLKCNPANGVLTVFGLGRIVNQPTVSGLALRAFERCRWITRA